VPNIESCVGDVLRSGRWQAGSCHNRGNGLRGSVWLPIETIYIETAVMEFIYGNLKFSMPHVCAFGVLVRVCSCERIL